MREDWGKRKERGYMRGNERESERKATDRMDGRDWSQEWKRSSVGEEEALKT